MPAVLSEKSRPWSVMNNWKGGGTNAVSTLWNCGNCGLSDYLSFKTEQLNLICINPFLMHRCGLIGELFQQFGKIFYIFIFAIVYDSWAVPRIILPPEHIIGDQICMALLSEDLHYYLNRFNIQFDIILFYINWFDCMHIRMALQEFNAFQVSFKSSLRSADIVMMTEKLYRLPQCVRLCRYALRIEKLNIAIPCILKLLQACVVAWNG